MDEPVSYAQVRAAIQKVGAAWQAGPTALSELPRDQQRKRLGLTPPPGEVTVEEVAAQFKQFRSPGPEIVTLRPRSGAAGLPAAFDLRNVDGQNFVTPVKDQGGCGSCVAFGTLAAVEGTFRRQRGDPNLAVDLSEAHLFYCIARGEGYDCGTGWWPENALNALQGTGVSDEACYPYAGGDQACGGLSPDWQSRVTRITSFRSVTGDHNAIQEHLVRVGPVTACMLVYDDFFAYRDGVYRHVTGELAGGHCVTIVGYDDGQGAWVCKNSWGTNWGSGGFFRIAYGDCRIDAWLNHAVAGIVETGALDDRQIVGLWAINQDRNAWVYVSDAGWRRIAPDNDNVFVDMLAQAVAAKAAARPVHLYQENGVIRHIYVL